MYKELFYEFEKYCCKKHQYDFPKQKTYHWCNIPEELLYDSGFITSFHDIRIRRKNDYEDGRINSIQEYFKELPTSTNFELIAIALNIPKDKLTLKIADFKKNSKIDYLNFNEFCNHFKNWANKNNTSNLKLKTSFK